MLFDSFKTSRFYVDYLDSLTSDRERSELGEMIREAYDEKVQSEEELDTYKLTRDDVIRIISEFEKI